MEEVQAVEVDVGQQESQVTQLKTEEEPTRWIACGDAVKLEKQEDLVQQGKLETET